jgi:uncharacterized repeat protein (TIGR01451 family)
VEGACTGEWIITRTWKVTDKCENETTHEQIIAVSDNIVPTFTAPGAITVNAGENCVYDAGVDVTGDVTDEADNCDTELQATFTDVIDDINPCELTITRTWSLADDCGNAAADQVQIITVIDNTPPIFTRPPNTEIYIDLVCEYDASPSETGDVYDEYDNCSVGLQATFLDVTDDTDPCNIIITRTWSLADDCGNAAANQVQIILVRDVFEPLISCPPDEAVAYGANVDPSVMGYPVVFDNCEEYLEATYEDINIEGSCSCNYEIQRTWTATDQCGNTSSCTQSIFVQDIEVPEISCPDGSPFIVTVNSGNTYYTHSGTDWDADADDNCTADDDISLSAMLTKVSVPANPNPGPHSSLDGVIFEQGLTTVTWTATDECDNSATCSFIVEVLGQADLAVDKVLTSTHTDGIISAGDPVTYTVTVTNNGPVASGPIVLTDQPPAEILNPEYSLDGTTWVPWTETIDIANLDDDASIEIYYRGTADCPTDKVITNTAFIDFAAGNPITDPDYDNNTSTVETGHRDHTPPTFTTPGPFNFCVIDIFSALYDGQPEPDADIMPEAAYLPQFPAGYTRPDWYIVPAGSTEFDLTYLDDNCCDENQLIISWTISFGGEHPEITGSGQPSTYDDPDVAGSPNPIKIWGTNNYLEVTHTITYTVTDCNGNAAEEPTSVEILIRPRPNVIKN